MRIIFLHLPKTAGQSVHAALTESFGSEVICPARVNEQLCVMSRTELARYQVFSGHFDWSLLDCLPGPKYVFTILRDPLERILSFYFYLRGKASGMEQADLEKPENQGLKAALGLSPVEYFLGGPPHLRMFLDDHYDNFYTYYFASRQYQGRRALNGLRTRGLLTDSEILNLALDNMSTIDDVFTINRMQDVFGMIADLCGSDSGDKPEYRVNQNKVLDPNDRIDELRGIGGTDEVVDRINDYCRMDSQLWTRYV